VPELDAFNVRVTADVAFLPSVPVGKQTAAVDVQTAGAVRPPTRSRYCDLAAAKADGRRTVFDTFAPPAAVARETVITSDLANEEDALGTDVDDAEVVLALILLTTGVTDTAVVAICL